MDRKQLGVLASAGVVVATLATVGAFAFGGDAPSDRSTVPAGQFVTSSALPAVDVPSSSTGSSAEAAAPSTTDSAPAPQQVAAVPNGPATEQPVVTTTTEAVPAPAPPVLTTTPPTSTQHTPSTPWCYDPINKVWYSGEGEGCTPQNPHFVEYR